jgi:hypothetical protein
VVTIGAGNSRFGLGALCVVERKQRRAILCAHVIALAVELGRVVNGEKDVEQRGQIDRCGIECHADGFGMAGRARTDLFVRRARHAAADIAAFDSADSDHVLKHRLGAPETAAGKDGFGHGGSFPDHSQAQKIGAPRRDVIVWSLNCRSLAPKTPGHDRNHHRRAAA